MRRPFNFRLSEQGHNWVEGLAKTHEVYLADVLRAAMTVAARHPGEVVQEIKDQKDRM